MQQCREGWHLEHEPEPGESADVLAAQLGCRAENLHKFHHAHTTDPPAADAWFTLQAGDLVLVDEAGMAGTMRLDWLTTYARERGALVRLLGDPSQLAAVELTRLHRFTDPAEAKATLKLRDGDPAGLDFYYDRGRVTSGTGDAMLQASYEAWANDTRARLHSLLIAASNDDVAALNARARLERIHTGQVEPDGADLRDGNCAGVGDRVVTRTNRRDLTINGGRDFVKNGDSWTVDRRHSNGDLVVRSAEHQAAVMLPADYVAESVELDYATTTARAQGTTVDTTHLLVDHTTTRREALYVAATRGRNGAHVYVATDDLLDISAERPPAPTPPDRIILEDALQREA